jgi:serine/threonine-protein kinase
MSLEGQILGEKYVIVRRIAEGGTSTVYLGIHQRIGKDVAVKVLRSAAAEDPEVLQRFEREARVVSRLRSAHIADVFDLGALPTGEPYMVMEYVDGESLAKIIERDQTIEPRKLLAMALQILDALAAAHGAGVVHRDLKPENVIVVPTRANEFVVKLIDFGISKVEGGAPSIRGSAPEASRGPDAAVEPLARVTAIGSVLGTPLYMSPEQASGHTPAIDHRTDLYSLGVILYEALAGTPPLTAETMDDLLFKIALDDPEPLRKRVPTLDRELCAIVERAMAKDPEDRYQTADDMRAAIVSWQERQAAAATKSEPVRYARRSTMRSGVPRARRWAIAVVSMAMGFVSVPAVHWAMAGSSQVHEARVTHVERGRLPAREVEITPRAVIAGAREGRAFHQSVP